MLLCNNLDFQAFEKLSNKGVPPFKRAFLLIIVKAIFMKLQPNYHESKLQVIKTAPGTFSHQLICYCKTIGCPATLEPEYLYKKVNFYKFRSFALDTLKVKSWQDWYFANRYNLTFLKALAAYINSEEKRTANYIHPDPISEGLDRLIMQARELNDQTRQFLQSH